MPELPEVETTRRGIATVMCGKPVRRFSVFDSRLRWPVPEHLEKTVQNKQVIACERRGKYLLLRFEHGTMLVHLGMSGSLRTVSMHEPLRKHDHAEWLLDDARVLYHDPRRFGAILWHSHADGPVNTHPLLANLGIEPFDAAFTPDYLHQGLRNRSQAIKQALLAGDVVVGVGNIYASESLFKARINPKTPAGRISLKRCQALHTAIIQTLTDALESGGSTLRDYVNATGQPGAYFALHAAVYERQGQPCRTCTTPIRRLVQGQRATYYCPKCQQR
jgi:formamidopyrimidine-DNA glycosylase